MLDLLERFKKFHKDHLGTFKWIRKGRSIMCKCKKAFAAATNMGKSDKADVVVTVNVTNIVKYVALAGVAIVGIIFGTKTWCDYVKNKEAEEE